MNIFVIDTDWKRRALVAFNLAKEGINAIPLDPSDPIEMSRSDPQLFLICDQDETRTFMDAVPPHSAIFCYSTAAQLRNVVTALKAGASDYFAWPEDLAVLVERVREVQMHDKREAANGTSSRHRHWAAEPRQAGRYPKHFDQSPRGGVVVDHPARHAAPGVGEIPVAAPPQRQRANELSARELEVLKLASHGLSSQAIADKLGIRRKTVEAHRNSILIKSRCNNMAEAVRWGIVGSII